ncbi:hypothetical protein VFPPC_15871 [Pochonia chlamydosporia 170]|uniref:Uncharacterized protein n=1 Tax=Pochonia chlamydosporia 170 TaxID=1380566 RepID=A0A179FUR2_METCM|nr:hypothetical protein VFPPC_15871 [Pochonia chlamydosporia 170]OAQ68739.1 hypothetical protein VFPPC_15871 [Pochonia chlamydosporia 170]
MMRSHTNISSPHRPCPDRARQPSQHSMVSEKIAPPILAGWQPLLRLFPSRIASSACFSSLPLPYLLRSPPSHKAIHHSLQQLENRPNLAIRVKLDCTERKPNRIEDPGALVDTEPIACLPLQYQPAPSGASSTSQV